MSEIDLPPYADVSAQVEQLQLGMDVAELHGSLCGYLSGGAALTHAFTDWRLLQAPALGLGEQMIRLRIKAPGVF